MEKRKKGMGLPIGGASLIMVFMLTCLATFAVISFVAAERDAVLSHKTAENVEAYYGAVSRAETMIAAVKQEPSAVQTLMEQEKDCSFELENGIITFEVPIQDEMFLRVELTPQGESYEQTDFREVNHRTVDDSPILLDLPAF